MRWWIGAPFRVLKAQLGPRWTALKGRVTTAAMPATRFLSLLSIALVERYHTAQRRRRGEPPRVIWGPSAILNVKYWSEALRRKGYESTTCVDIPSTITSREDWDLVQDDFAGSGPLALWVQRYEMFAWALRHGEVFPRFFDMGFLRGTPLERIEYPLTRLAGKKMIVLAYGGDIAVPEYLGRFKEVTLEDYPELPEHADVVKRRVRHTLRWANLRLRTLTLGYQPEHDATCMNLLLVDTELWNGPTGGSEADGTNGEVVVVHAPNHRRIKGTHLLEEAVRGLRSDGLNVRLNLLEGSSNEEVRRAVLESDIVADQFYGGAGLFAVEGMAAGKPVLGNLKTEWVPEEVMAAKAKQGCPIIDSSPEQLREDLRRLVVDPKLRVDLGRSGRDFVLRWHSYESVGKDWEDLVEHVWSGRPLPERFLPGRG